MCEETQKLTAKIKFPITQVSLTGQTIGRMNTNEEILQFFPQLYLIDTKEK